MNNQFEECKQKLQECYEKYPRKTIKKINSAINMLEPKSKKELSKQVFDELFELICIVCFIILLTIIEISNVSSNAGIESANIFFGIFTFVCGLIPGLYLSVPGFLGFLIFGYFGLSLLAFNQIPNILNSPFFSDASSGIVYFWFGLFICLILAGFILTFIYNVNNNFKKNRSLLLIILGCFLLAFAIIQYVPILYGWV